MMNTQQLRVFNGMAFIVFMGLLLVITPEFVVPVGFAFGLAICGLIQYDEWNIRRETRGIDAEHERL